jgi:valyl-tRNA synthetase
VLRDLEAAGLRRGEKSHMNAIGRCQRCDTVLEPLVSLQWFVRIKPLADKASSAADRGDVRFTPELWKKTYDEWMRNIRDWCVSRQLWWGHEIPAWYCPNQHVTVPKPGEPDPTACGECASPELVRDPDVFDTWFSSWLMPLSVFGWPEKTDDLRRFFPTSVLVTGFDILFFWVARMIMAGEWFGNDVPFRDVFLHGLVRVDGEKMSKTKGNVIDPLVMCDEYGADAVRFTLARASGTGRDPSVNNSRFEESRNFATKVWNAARFAMQMIGEERVTDEIDFASLSTIDRWILARLSECAGEVNASLEAFRFDEAANALWRFFWSEFCDGYVELVKPVLRGDAPESEKAKTRAVLRRVLLDSLALLHPFMPFVSSEIREALNGDGKELAKASFPDANPAWSDPLAVETVEVLRAAATRLRNLRAEPGLPQTEPLAAGLEAPDGPLAASLAAHRGLLVHMARLSSLEVAPKVDLPDAFHDAIGGVGLVVALPRKELSASERTKLEKELASLEKEADALQKKLGNVAFLSRAPEDVVAKSKKQLAELDERRRRLSGNLGA